MTTGIEATERGDMNHVLAMNYVIAKERDICQSTCSDLS